MAGFHRLHNKFHRSSHHTLTGTDTVDGGSDPIASEQLPFNGIFYNNLTDQFRTYNILTNSYDWNSVYVTVNTLSSDWGLIKTTYTTVNTKSANWDKGFSAYTTLKEVSSNYNSVYNTVCANSAAWSESEFILYTNRVQENTRSKTFKGYNLTAYDNNTVDWNLNIAQVAFLNLDKPELFLNNPLPSSMKKGGIYNLHVYQKNSVGGYDLYFGDKYLFPLTSESTLNYSPSGFTIFNFFCDGEYMHGDCYQTNLIEYLVNFIDETNIKKFNNEPISRFTENLDYLAFFNTSERIFKLGTSPQIPIIRYP